MCAGRDRTDATAKPGAAATLAAWKLRFIGEAGNCEASLIVAVRVVPASESIPLGTEVGNNWQVI